MMTNIYDIAGFFTVGFFSGVVFCGFGCPAFIGVYVSAISSSVKESMKITFLFNIGRFFTYLLLAALSAYFGKVIIDKFGIVPHVIFVVFMVLVGIYMFFPNKNNSCKSSSLTGWYRKLLKKSGFSAVFVGILTAFIPCVPFSAVVTYSAGKASIADAMLAASAFTLGSSIMYMLIIGALTGFLSNKINEKIGNRLIFQRICGAIIVILAIHDLAILV